MNTPSKEAIEARELIKRSCTVPNAQGECYMPSDETIDMIIQAAIDAAVAEPIGELVRIKKALEEDYGFKFDGNIADATLHFVDKLYVEAESRPAQDQ